MEESKRSRGRPKKEVAKYVKLSIRMTEEEYRLLSNASETVGKTKSEIAREGVVISANNALYCHNLNKNDEDESEETIDEDYYDDYMDYYDDYMDYEEDEYYEE